jgi:hypothetical protein
VNVNTYNGIGIDSVGCLVFIHRDLWFSVLLIVILGIYFFALWNNDGIFV